MSIVSKATNVGSAFSSNRNVGTINTFIYTQSLLRLIYLLMVPVMQPSHLHERVVLRPVVVGAGPILEGERGKRAPVCWGWCRALTRV